MHRVCVHCERSISFFFNGPATTEIYTLSLHDALPILGAGARTKQNVSIERCRNLRGICRTAGTLQCPRCHGPGSHNSTDRKSTRLNSSHVKISYAVFCLKKKTCTRRHIYSRERSN